MFILDRKQRAKRGSIAEVDIKQEPGKYILMDNLWKYLSHPMLKSRMGLPAHKIGNTLVISCFHYFPMCFGLVYAFCIHKVTSWIFRFERCCIQNLQSQLGIWGKNDKIMLSSDLQYLKAVSSILQSQKFLKFWSNLRKMRGSLKNS